MKKILKFMGWLISIVLAIFVVLILPIAVLALFSEGHLRI